MIIAIAGQKEWKESETLEEGYIEMTGKPSKENHFAIDGVWLTPEEFMS